MADEQVKAQDPFQIAAKDQSLPMIQCIKLSNKKRALLFKYSPAKESLWLDTPLQQMCHTSRDKSRKALSGYDGFWLCSMAQQVHEFVIRGGFDSDIFVGNGLITYYTKCEDVASARKVFDEMSQRDVVSWNSMVSGYSQSGAYEECKDLYRLVLGCCDFKPNGFTVISVLQACGQSSDLIFGMEVHKMMLENRIQMDLSLCNVVIGFYAKCGSLDYAKALFDEMSENDSVTFGAIISGYMAHGLVDEAMCLFSGMEDIGLCTWNAVISGLMQNNHHEEVVNSFREMIRCGLRANTVTLSTLLPSLTYCSNLKGGKEVHAFAVRDGCDSNIYVTTSLIDNYAKLGFLRGAQRVYDNCKERSLIVWTAIITAYAVHGDSYSACSLVDQMQCVGTMPDNVTLTAALSACAHSAESDMAHKIFYSMLTKYDIEPGVEHYACMVSVLSRAGKRVLLSRQSSHIAWNRTDQQQLRFINLLTMVSTLVIIN